MPSPNTITAFYSFTPSTTIRSTQVNNNFNVFRGHLVSVDASLASLAHMSYDLGSYDYSWRNCYARGYFLFATATGDTPATTTVYNIYVKSTDGKMYKKDSTGTETGVGSGSFAGSNQDSLTSGVAISLTANENFQFITVKSAGGEVTLSATLFGNSAPSDRLYVKLCGQDDANYPQITFADVTYGAVGNFTTLNLTKYITAGFVYSSTLQRWVYED